MFETLAKAKDMFNVYRAGQNVYDEIFLKKAQLTVNALSVLLITIVTALKAFNVDIPITDAQITEMAGALFTVIGLFNAHATVASTDKFGILPEQSREPARDSNTTSDAGMFVPPSIPDAVAEKPVAKVLTIITPGSQGPAWPTPGI